LITKISKGDAREFRQYLDCGSKTTETEICRKSRRIFNLAVSKRWISENPFQGMSGWTLTNDERAEYVPLSRINPLFKVCEPEWKAILVMARVAGMRPCEIIRLEWKHVESDILAVHSPKTGYRETPMFPDVRECLAAVPREGKYVLSRYNGDHHRTLDSALRRRFKRAKVEPWSKVFTNMRSSAEMDLLDAGFGIEIVTKWLGHSKTIARRHYIKVNQTHIDKAVKAGPKKRSKKRSTISGI
ncbi:MAG: tyrosine-type recombinase/integrase, partial [Planctomycetota bacterium]